MVGDSSHITMHRVATECILNVLASVNALM